METSSRNGKGNPLEYSEGHEYFFEVYNKPQSFTTPTGEWTDKRWFKSRNLDSSDLIGSADYPYKYDITQE